MNTNPSLQNDREDDLSKASSLSLLSQSNVILTTPNNEYPGNITTTSTNTTFTTAVNCVRVQPHLSRHHPRRQVNKSKNEKEETSNNTDNNDFEYQLTDTAWDKLLHALDRTGNIALASSLELFKVAVLPSIKLTKTYIVPEIGSKILNCLEENISQRITDWSNVGLILCGKLVDVVFRSGSESEKEGSSTGFMEKMGVVGNSFVEFVSSDQGRQCLVDVVALFVKCMDALRTPATKAYLDQMTIFTLRIIECISSSSFQQLLYDVQEFIWCTIELASDPKSIEALAEITADICHALEMEQYYYKQKKRRCVPKAKRARRRRDRGRSRYHTQSRSKFSTVAEEGDAIQEVMKSAMGDGTHVHLSDTQSCTKLPNECSNSIPHQINITSSSASAPPTMEDDVSVPSTPTDFHSFVQHRQEQLSSIPDLEDLRSNHSSTMTFLKQLDTTLTQNRTDKISSISKKKKYNYHPNSVTTSALKPNLDLKILSSLANSPTKDSSKTSSKQWLFLLIGFLLVSCFMLIVSCLGMYGFYSLLLSKPQVATIQQPPQEMVIRIVYENHPYSEKGQLNHNKIKSIQIEQDHTASVITPILKEIEKSL